MDTALLLLRVAVGLLLIGHGTQKLFGWFGGYGLSGVGGFFDSVGFRPGKPMAVVAGVLGAAAVAGRSRRLLRLDAQRSGPVPGRAGLESAA
jgi:uncharacterized membrane protein YphA (DoxX/SURF4 family)